MPGTPVRVLVVDDVAELRELIRIKLELEPGFAVVGEASDGARAAELANATQPDWVLLDLAMPVMDGLEALPLIRRASPRAKIAVLSAFAGNAIVETALELGADLFLDKATALVELPTPLADEQEPPKRRR